MKKMNNKGFLLVETIVVATFTLTVLIALFLEFKNLLTTYNNSHNYNSVQSIYDLKNIKKYITQYENKQNQITKQLSDSSKPYLIIYNGSCSTELGLSGLNLCEEIMTAANIKTVIYTDSDPSEIKKYIKINEDSNLSEQMRNMIKRIETVDNQNRLIAEFNDGTLATIVFGVNEKAKPEPLPDPSEKEESQTTPNSEGGES